MKPQPITAKGTNEDFEGGKIRVGKSDSNGEVQYEVVRADHFKPKFPKRPKFDERRITLIRRGSAIGPTGHSVIYMTSHREKELEFWEAHSTCLTREERRDIANGHTTSILRPIPPGWKKGDRVEVADKIEATIFDLEETHRGHRIVFRVIDFRPMLPKRTIGGGSRPKVDAFGYPAELTPAEKERARIDGAYTRSASLAIPGTDDELDDKLHRRLHAEASMGNAMRQSRGRVRVSKLQLEQRLADARKKHRGSTVRYLERQLASLTEKEAAAAA